MTPITAIVPLFTHLLPILFFMYMMLDVLLRDPRRTEHRLVFGILCCCMLMFTEEFVRHYLPIEISPVISVVWFSTAGITIVGLALHFFLKLTRFDRRMPRLLYPYLCYLPTALALVNLLFNDQMISGNEFQQVGIWKLPVYNDAYYIAMVGSNLFSAIFMAILHVGKRRAATRELKDMYHELLVGAIVTVLVNLAVGLVDFKGALPPYPYIYGGFVWCLLLRRTMKKYDLLNRVDNRYEKLFLLNPSAIVLADEYGKVKEANPSARQLFGSIGLTPGDCYAVLGKDLERKIRAGEDIRDYETTFRNGDAAIDVRIDGDYVLVEYEPHLILIVRDVTLQMENERAIQFLAYHDALTRLPNRRHFFERLEAAIASAERAGESLAVVLFDIDDFKGINDKFGHQAGDRALIRVADCIRSVAAPEEATARLGGDEFVLFLHPLRSVGEAKEKIRALRRELDARPVTEGDNTIPIRLSIGVSLYPADGREKEALLNSADKALYHVKRNGRNDYAIVSDI